MIWRRGDATEEKSCSRSTCSASTSSITRDLSSALLCTTLSPRMSAALEHGQDAQQQAHRGYPLFRASSSTVLVLTAS